MTLPFYQRRKDMFSGSTTLPIIAKEFHDLISFSSEILVTVLPVDREYFDAIIIVLVAKTILESLIEKTLECHADF